MARIVLPLNATYTIAVNNGTSRNFVFNADGTFTIPSNLNIGNTSNLFRAIINAGNIATADKTFNLPNRSGNFALEDLTSLNAMLPNQAGNAGKAITTDGAGTLSWTAVNNSLVTFNGISTSTYNAQTFATPGTSGTAPSWTSTNSNTNTHTLNIPMASATGVTAGLLSKADYDLFPKKNTANTFTTGQIFNGTSSTFAIPPTITTPGTGNSDVATYGQVLAARNGVGLRPPVAILDTINYTTALPTALTHSGESYTYAIDDRVLFTNLTGTMASYNNRIFKVAGITGTVTWVGGGSTPTAELDGQAGTGAPSDGDIVFVKNGTNYADQQWAYNGTAWIQYNATSAYTFSTGLNLTGSTVTVVYGTTDGTACVGNDSRLSDSRTPLAHVLDSASHTISGKTAGQVLIATAATTFGFVTFSQDVTVSGAGVVTITKINNVPINNLGLAQNSATLIDNTVTATLVAGCSWAIATYRSIRIQFSMSRGAGNYSTGYISLIHDGTTPRMTLCIDDEIGIVWSALASPLTGLWFSVDINAGNIRLLYQTSSTGTAVTMRFTNEAYPV